MIRLKRSFLLLLSLGVVFNIHAQKKPSPDAKNGVYVDKTGTMRWQKTDKEASFFGVNYTVPFAYGYRAIKRLGVNPEEAIQQDVYHFSRLGLNAFRVHVWDTEISDSLGNLLNNEHLRLFDFLIAELKKRDINILITPIAFWGNGWPEKDEKTGGFSSVYGKDGSLREEKAILAQENYLQQFFQHKNPYTGLTYQQDPHVIATEINNEPHHSGSKAFTTAYINRMVAAVKSTGFTKPIFYNISESPAYADAVVNSNVQGYSFQWYPTGLVAGHTLKGNYLPNVNRYKIPFDTIPGFKNGAKMVYEFDAADVLEPIMYPAMAKSFRAAGFQWATQFAYDPMSIAYANTEYSTHYLNLAYTPAKAISLLIAAKAFRSLPIYKNTGPDTLFSSFRINYKEALSEMNTPKEFYYANNTSSTILDAKKIEHIAGVGSSKTVKYDGTGAYFLDQVEKGIWRLEVMPDANFINDPFAKASPQKYVSRISWNSRKMEINLQDLAQDFSIQALNAGNNYQTKASKGLFEINPGTYILVAKSARFKKTEQTKYGNILLAEFVAPKASPISGPLLVHHPISEVSEGKSFNISTNVSGITLKEELSLELRNSQGKWKTISLQKVSGDEYTATVPAEMVTSGMLSYRIMVKDTEGEITTFPANVKGNPYAWDYYRDDAWQVSVMPIGSILELFNPKDDQTSINTYNPDWKNTPVQYINSEKSSHLLMKITMDAIKSFGFQNYLGHKLAGRKTELQNFKNLIVKASTSNALAGKTKIALIDANGNAFATELELTNQMQEITIPLKELKPSSMLLLPRPYPGFLPLHYGNGHNALFNIQAIEKVEISIDRSNLNDTPLATEVLIESIYLK